MFTSCPLFLNNTVYFISSCQENFVRSLAAWSFTQFHCICKKSFTVKVLTISLANFLSFRFLTNFVEDLTCQSTVLLLFLHLHI
uniref:Uncharacterized protein n=1 Tax=Octopus bimaculoides TaxID=37653 RepID=A0A0L8HZ86_OCTBM